MWNRILLFMMKNKLKRYKKNCEWYHREGAEPNWYDEQGIPNLEKDIKTLEIKMERWRTL